MRRGFAVVAVVVAFAVGSGALGCHRPPPAQPASPALDPPAPTLRLPRNFLPTGYAVRLDIDPARAWFTGTIRITGTLAQRSAAIWLNATKLTIRRAVAQHGDDDPVALTATASGTDFISLRPAQPLDAGQVTLIIDYAGDLELHSTDGAFRQVVNGAGYVYTQFESTSARRTFPCFDEPDNKVPWTLTLDVPASLTAVANAPIAHELLLPPHRKRVEFQPTRPLPSYLIAFAVGPFDIVDAGKTRAGTPIRVLTLAHRAADGAYAAKTTARLVALLEDYLGAPYPFAKLDLIAVPFTIGFEAMENAGLITCAETAMLFAADSSVQRQLDWILIAAHELAHQWLGDLVTMAWWDDTWLSEGFATWLAAKITAKFEPAWHAEQIALTSRLTALYADAETTARQIRQPIEQPGDIVAAFDRISYDKAASVLAMFESYLGADGFQRGVHSYLARRAWSNATSADFLAALGEATRITGVNVAPALASFLDQPGSPLIQIETSCRYHFELHIQLTQQRYAPPGSPPGAATTPWMLPVCMAYQLGTGRAQICKLLDQPTAEIVLRLRHCPSWVLPNADGRGYYRTAISELEVEQLRDAGWSELSWPERRALFADVVDGVTAGRLPLPLALSLVPKLVDGGDRFAVSAAIGLVSSLSPLVTDEDRPAYQGWMRRTFGAAAEQAGILPKRGEPLDVEASRSWLIGAVAWLGRDPKLVANAVALARNWHQLPYSIRGTVLSIAVDASPELFDQLLGEVATERDRGRRWQMLWALAAVRDPARKLRALGLVLDAKLEARDALQLLSGTNRAGDPSGDGPTIAQQFFRDHQAQLMRALPHAGTSTVFTPLIDLFTETCRADQRDAIADYVTATFASLPGGQRAVANAIERMDQCIAERGVQTPAVHRWLASPPAP